MTAVTSTEPNSHNGDAEFVKMADRNLPAKISPDAPAFHPLADLFPLMECEEFDNLVESIRVNGLRDALPSWTIQILDGRNRFRACREAGVEPQFDRLPNGDDPLRFVIDKNLRRRHLKESQRATVAARLTTLKHGGDRRSDQAANLPVVSQAAAAKLMNISERSVRSASTVLEKGIPEVVSAVERGEIAVSTAAHFVERPKQEQSARIISAGSARDAVKAIKAAAQKKHMRIEAEAAMHRDKAVIPVEATPPDVSKEAAPAHKDGPSDFEILIRYFGKLRSENPSSQLTAGRLLPSDRAAKLRDISGPLRDCEFAVELLPHLVRILTRAKAKRAKDGAAEGAAGEP